MRKYFSSGSGPDNSRRRFFKNLSTGLGAAALATAAFPFLSATTQNAAQDKNKKLGVALVGLGSLSKNQIAPALLKTKNCYLAGIVTGTPAKAEEWSKKYNIPKKNIYNYQNFDTIAKNKDIDLVYIVLPNSMHHEFTIRAAKAGKHVLCEKPMANTVKECEEMIAACKKAGKQLAIGYRLHFEPHNLEMKRLGQEKVFGQVKLVEAADGFRIGDPNQWRLKKDLAGGGALMDVGIYALQGCRYVIGEEPLTVTAQEFKTDPVKFKEVDETIFWQMKFPGGATASCTTSYAASTERLFASAEKGWMELRPAYGYGGIKGRTSKGEMNFPQIDHFEAQMDDFANCIQTNKPTSVPG
jgi:predicted dehydrogenase